jgi:hypothetical protein
MKIIITKGNIGEYSNGKFEKIKKIKWRAG